MSDALKSLFEKSSKSLADLEKHWQESKGDLKAIKKMSGISEAAWNIFSEDEWSDFFDGLDKVVSQQPLNEGPDQSLIGKWTVKRSGGSIGDKPSNPTAATVNPAMTFDSQEEAKELAKRRNKQLSPGEKKYYGIKYKAVQITEGYFEPYNVQAANGQRATVSVGKPVMNMQQYGLPNKDLLYGEPVQPGKFYAISYRTGAWMGPYNTAEEAARHSKIVKVYSEGINETGEYDKGDPVMLLKCPSCGNTDYNALRAWPSNPNYIECTNCGKVDYTAAFDGGLTEDLDAQGRWVPTPLKDIVAGDPDRGTYVGYTHRSKADRTNQADALVKWGSKLHHNYQKPWIFQELKLTIY